jgi:hypothetical protein
VGETVRLLRSWRSRVLLWRSVVAGARRIVRCESCRLTFAVDLEALGSIVKARAVALSVRRMRRRRSWDAGPECGARIQAGAALFASGLAHAGASLPPMLLEDAFRVDAPAATIAADVPAGAPA